MVGVLLAFGVETDLALAAVLAYRSIAIWLPAPIGLVALGALRKTITRWGSESEAAEPTARPATLPIAAPALPAVARRIEPAGPARRVEPAAPARRAEPALSVAA
jgi:hypothetical protein